MEYTQEMFEEDKRIAYYVYSKCFLRSYRYKDDLIAVALKGLYKYHSSYDNSKGKYFTYACRMCWFSMLEFLKREKTQTRNFEMVSLDKPIKVGSDDNLSDFITADIPDFNSNLNLAYLNNVINEILVNKGQTYQKVIRLLMQGYIPKHIAEILGISRQCSCLYKDRFKALLKERLQKDGYMV